MKDVLVQIAQRQLRISTLETRNADSLDFHEVGVWAVKAALEEAFRAGQAAATKTNGAANRATRKNARRNP